jgi:hypothetical protein
MSTSPGKKDPTRNTHTKYQRYSFPNQVKGQGDKVDKPGILLHKCAHKCSTYCHYVRGCWRVKGMLGGFGIHVRITDCYITYHRWRHYTCNSISLYSAAKCAMLCNKLIRVHSVSWYGWFWVERKYKVLITVCVTLM